MDIINYIKEKIFKENVDNKFILFEKYIYTIYIVFIVLFISIFAMKYLFLNINLINFFLGMTYLLIFLIYIFEIYIMYYSGNNNFKKMQYILSYLLILFSIIVFIIIIFTFKTENDDTEDYRENNVAFSLFNNNYFNKSKIYFLFCFFFIFIFIIMNFSAPNSNLDI